MSMLTTATIIGAVGAVFAACCTAIARAAFDDRASRADVLLALYWTLAFAAAVIGCLALADARGDAVAALYAAVLCLAALVAGRVLAQSWRAKEVAEAARFAELRALVDRYRADEDSVEARCARAARAFDLTRREEEMLALLLAGRSRAEIARELFVSANTVKTHIRNLYRKLGVSGKDELAKATEAAAALGVTRL